MTKQTKTQANPRTRAILSSRFMTTISKTHGLPLPSSLPNATNKSLPKSKFYRAVCEKSGITPVGWNPFYKLRSLLMPTIDTMKPSSDLCFECQQTFKKSCDLHTRQQRPSLSGYSRLRHITACQSRVRMLQQPNY